MNGNDLRYFRRARAMVARVGFAHASDTATPPRTAGPAQALLAAFFVVFIARRRIMLRRFHPRSAKRGLIVTTPTARPPQAVSNPRTNPIRDWHRTMLRLSVAPSALDPATVAINLGAALRDAGLHALTERIPLHRWEEIGALLRAAGSVYNGFVHQLDPNTTGIALSCPHCGRPTRKADTQQQAIAALYAHVLANKSDGLHPRAIPTARVVADTAAGQDIECPPVQTPVTPRTWRPAARRPRAWPIRPLPPQPAQHGGPCHEPTTPTVLSPCGRRRGRDIPAADLRRANVE